MNGFFCDFIEFWSLALVLPCHQMSGATKSGPRGQSSQQQNIFRHKILSPPPLSPVPTRHPALVKEIHLQESFPRPPAKGEHGAWDWGCLQEQGTGEHPEDFRVQGGW